MPNVYSKALNESIEVNRIIGEIKGRMPGPTVIFTAGIHGNEPSGIFALNKVLKQLQKIQVPVCGNIYAISGNLWALERGVRYEQNDLNRLWTVPNIDMLSLNGTPPKNNDVQQQKEVYSSIQHILASEQGPFYFMDLHTTSSDTIPFLTVNDSLLNREFTQQYPIPIILGIEEYLDGPLLSYINELGYVAFGYEAGQHDELTSIENQIAFINLTLVFTGCVKKEDVDFHNHYNLLAKNTVKSRDIYEVIYQYIIDDDEHFKMNPGFFNFQSVQKGIPLASSNNEVVKCPKKGRIFMPLYQNQGSDGYFVIQSIPEIFLWLSAVLRKYKFDWLLVMLPGILWENEKRESIKVNRRIARFLTKQIFHLLGYRSKRLDKTHYIMKSRERLSRNADYEDAPWT